MKRIEIKSFDSGIVRATVRLPLWFVAEFEYDRNGNLLKKHSYNLLWNRRKQKIAQAAYDKARSQVLLEDKVRILESRLEMLIRRLPPA